MLISEWVKITIRSHVQSSSNVVVVQKYWEFVGISPSKPLKPITKNYNINGERQYNTMTMTYQIWTMTNKMNERGIAWEAAVLGCRSRSRRVEINYPMTIKAIFTTSSFRFSPVLFTISLYFPFLIGRLF